MSTNIAKNVLAATFNALVSPLRSKEPPLFLVGHGRSGTSWIGTRLALAGNGLYYNEPCNPSRWDQRFEDWFVYSPAGSSNRYLERALDPCVAGYVTRGRAWPKSQTMKRLKRDHIIVIKDVTSTMCVEWIANRYGANLILLSRHPCAVALSEIRHKTDWQRALQVISLNPSLDSYFGSQKLAQLAQINDAWEAYGAIWAMRNHFLERGARANPSWIAVQYETVMDSPLVELRKLFERFHLQWNDEIAKEIENSVLPGEHAHSWKKHLSHVQVEKVKQGVSYFEAPFYSLESFTKHSTL